MPNNFDPPALPKLPSAQAWRRQTSSKFASMFRWRDARTRALDKALAAYDDSHWNYTMERSAYNQLKNPARDDARLEINPRDPRVDGAALAASEQRLDTLFRQADRNFGALSAALGDWRNANPKRASELAVKALVSHEINGQEAFQSCRAQFDERARERALPPAPPPIPAAPPPEALARGRRGTIAGTRDSVMLDKAETQLQRLPRRRADNPRKESSPPVSSSASQESPRRRGPSR